MRVEEVGLVAPNRRMRNEYKILIGFGDLGVNERMILKCIIKKYGVRLWIGFFDSE